MLQFVFDSDGDTDTDTHACDKGSRPGSSSFLTASAQHVAAGVLLGIDSDEGHSACSPHPGAISAHSVEAEEPVIAITKSGRSAIAVGACAKKRTAQHQSSVRLQRHIIERFLATAPHRVVRHDGWGSEHTHTTQSQQTTEPASFHGGRG
jgi:hypothetical protein